MLAHKLRRVAEARVASTYLGSGNDAGADSTTRTITLNGGVRTGKWAVALTSRKATAGTNVAPTLVRFCGTALTMRKALIDGRNYASIWISTADITSDGTDNVVATWASEDQGQSTFAMLYSLDNLQSTTAVATASSTASPGTLNVNVSAGGCVIACGINAGTANYAWTGVTEDYDNLDGSNGRSSASGDFVSASTPRAVSVTHSTTEGAAVAVSLR